MSLDPMPTARELRAMAEKRGVLPPNGPATATKPAQPTVRPWHPYRSKWEHEYAQRLAIQYDAGIIRQWDYEPERLLIGVGASYTPDFRVRHLNGRYEWIEVKGYRREAAMVRIKAAALRYPKDYFTLATKRRGEWHHDTIDPAPAGGAR